MKRAAVPLERPPLNFAWAEPRYYFGASTISIWRPSVRG
ncbi:hypothetical protein SAMN06295937_102318 [Sphingopyxis flava]|uniref:Uncharacterized protein n=1 Tax=Sphingopyxis flava TaxID=1507287 RepID=A0A1T5EMQ1_9SPHN|nr:hypothetical protein SAMN06295937_102318 [Sphingopyxis flava]